VVERQFPKLEVAGPIPVFRSKARHIALFFFENIKPNFIAEKYKKELI
jgi:hypothetical protein